MPRKPRSTPKPRLNIQLEPELQGKLREIAKTLGYLIPSGENVGEGSISRLLKAVASGEIKVHKNTKVRSKK